MSVANEGKKNRKPKSFKAAGTVGKAVMEGTTTMKGKYVHSRLQHSKIQEAFDTREEQKKAGKKVSPLSKAMLEGVIDESGKFIDENWYGKLTSEEREKVQELRRKRMEQAQLAERKYPTKGVAELLSGKYLGAETKTRTPMEIIQGIYKDEGATIRGRALAKNEARKLGIDADKLIFYPNGTVIFSEPTKPSEASVDKKLSDLEKETNKKDYRKDLTKIVSNLKNVSDVQREEYLKRIKATPDDKLKQIKDDIREDLIKKQARRHTEIIGGPDYKQFVQMTGRDKGKIISKSEGPTTYGPLILTEPEVQTKIGKAFAPIPLAKDFTSFRKQFEDPTIAFLEYKKYLVKEGIDRDIASALAEQGLSDYTKSLMPRKGEGAPPYYIPQIKTRAQLAAERMTINALADARRKAEAGMISLGKGQQLKYEVVDQAKIPMIKFDKKTLSEEEQKSLERIMKRESEVLYKIYKKKGEIPKTIWDTFTIGQKAALIRIPGYSTEEAQRTLLGRRLPGTVTVQRRYVSIPKATTTALPRPEMTAERMEKLRVRTEALPQIREEMKAEIEPILAARKKAAETGMVTGGFYNLAERTRQIKEGEERAAAIKRPIYKAPTFKPGSPELMKAAKGQALLAGGIPGKVPTSVRLVQAPSKEEEQYDISLATPSAVGGEITPEDIQRLATARYAGQEELRRQLGLYADRRKAAMLELQALGRLEKAKPKGGYTSSALQEAYKKKFSGLGRLKIRKEPHRDFTTVYFTLVAPTLYERKEHGITVEVIRPYSSPEELFRQIDSLLDLMNMRRFPGAEIKDVLQPEIKGKFMRIKVKVDAIKY